MQPASRLASSCLVFILALFVTRGDGGTETVRPMVLIKGGLWRSFLKDPKSRLPQEETVKDFKMDVFPVTRFQFYQFIKRHPQWSKEDVPSLFADAGYLKAGFGGEGPEVSPNAPIVEVSWFAARAYCQSEGKRLPTLAEWEWAAWQKGVPNQEKPNVAAQILKWYGTKSKLSAVIGAVGSSNALGLYHMHGFIWEWVEDFSTVVMPGRGDSNVDSFYCGSGALGSADPSDYATFLRYAFRSSLKARYSTESLGFRCAQ